MLIAVTVAVLAGAVILFPSLALLFRLFLGGHLGDPAAPPEGAQTTTTGVRNGASTSTLARVAGALLLAGFALLNLADAPLAHLFGVLCLLAFLPVAFSAVFPGDAVWAAGADEEAR